MTEEERERLMDFLLEQHARFEARSQSFENALQEQQRTSQKTDRQIGQLRRILESALRIGQRERRDIRAKFEALIDAQIRNEDNIAAQRLLTEKALKELAQAQTRTEESLLRTNERIVALEEIS